MPSLKAIMATPGRGPTLRELDDPAFVCAERENWRNTPIGAIGAYFFAVVNDRPQLDLLPTPRPAEPCRDGCVCYRLGGDRP